MTRRRLRILNDLCQGLSPGSYLVEVDNPEYVYEDIRIDINFKGKHRARKNNPVQPNQVVPY